MTLQAPEILVNEIAGLDLTGLAFFGVVTHPRFGGSSPLDAHGPDRYFRKNQPRPGPSGDSMCRRGHRSRFRLTRHGRLRLEGYVYPGAPHLEPHDCHETFTGDYWGWFAHAFTEHASAENAVLVPFRNGRIVLDEREWIHGAGRMDRPRVAPGTTLSPAALPVDSPPGAAVSWTLGCAFCDATVHRLELQAGWYRLRVADDDGTLLGSITVEEGSEDFLLAIARSAVALHAFAPDRLPGFCPPCDACYCKRHRRADGRCPEGHPLRGADASPRPGSLPYDAMGPHAPDLLPPGAWHGARCWLWRRDDPRECHGFAEGEHQVGRGPDCQMVLRDSSVSRLHAKLHVARWSVRLEDAGSKHGTFVNDRRVQAVSLEDGDRIVLGQVALVFRDGNALRGESEPWDLHRYTEAYNTWAWTVGFGDIHPADVEPEARTAYEGIEGRKSLRAFARDRFDAERARAQPVTFSCAACTRVAGGVQGSRGGFSATWPGPRGTRRVDLTAEDVEQIRRVVARAPGLTLSDVMYVYTVLVPCFCVRCELAYCSDHWQWLAPGEPGTFQARCPQGHERSIPVTAPPERVDFRCAECSSEDGYLELDLSDPVRPRITLAGPGSRGRESGEVSCALGVRVGKALSSPDPAAALYALHVPYAPGFCPACGLSYCSRHWLIHGGGADRHGRKEGWCPRRHARVFPGDDDD